MGGKESSTNVCNDKMTRKKQDFINKLIKNRDETIYTVVVKTKVNVIGHKQGIPSGKLWDLIYVEQDESCNIVQQRITPNGLLNIFFPFYLTS